MFGVIRYGIVSKQEGAIKRYSIALVLMAGLATPFQAGAESVKNNTLQTIAAPAVGDQIQPQSESGVPPVKHPGKMSIHDLAGKYSDTVKMAAIAHGVPPRIVASILFVESRGKKDAVSQSGAIGLMQIMPDTAAKTLKINPWNARQNIDGGAAYISQLIDRFGSIRAGLIAYNEGPALMARGIVMPAAAGYAVEVEGLASMDRSG